MSSSISKCARLFKSRSKECQRVCFSTSQNRLNHQSPYLQRENDNQSNEEQSFQKSTSKTTPLYSEHIDTTPIQKLLLFVGSSAISLIDQYRDDLVAISGETSGVNALVSLRQRMLVHQEGAQILRDRPCISSRTLDLNALFALPENTLGHQYVRFMRKYNITCDSRKPVKYVDNEELAYVMRRYRETHDLVHLVCRMRPNMLGEVVIKWVEALQTQLPMCYGAAIMGALRLSAPQRKLYRDAYLKYAFDCGSQGRLLMNCYYEQRWNQDLEELRAEFKIPAATHSSML